jgi:hypothetical protein
MLAHRVQQLPINALEIRAVSQLTKSANRKAMKAFWSERGVHADNSVSQALQGIHSHAACSTLPEFAAVEYQHWKFARDCP